MTVTNKFAKGTTGACPPWRVSSPILSRGRDSSRPSKICPTDL